MRFLSYLLTHCMKEGFEMKMDNGFTLIEFIITLFLLSIFVTMGFVVFNQYIEILSGSMLDLEVQSNIRFAANFINDLLLASDLSEVSISREVDGSFKLLIKKCLIQKVGSQLMVDHQYPSSKSNSLANYVTNFYVTNRDGVISVNLVGGSQENDELISLDIVVYVGDSYD